MTEGLENYSSALLAFGAMGGLMLAQILVVDVMGIRRQHAPGMPVDGNHDDPLFRATRAHANTNESIAVFILLSLFCILSSAPPTWTNGLAISYVLTRILYTACYYANLKIMRSVVFGLSLAVLLGLLVTGLAAIWQGPLV